MRYFRGLTSNEIASVLGVSPQSVNRDCSLAKGWLTRRDEPGTPWRPNARRSLNLGIRALISTRVGRWWSRFLL
jgi:ECF sigma factor